MPLRAMLSRRLGKNPGPVREEPRRDHSDIVYDHQLVALKPRGQLLEIGVLSAARSSIKQKHAGTRAIIGRLLCDTISGKGVVKF